MISCRQARALLVEHVRGAASEASLLQLDLHLADCAECRVERARWATVGALRQWQPPALGAAARARIVKRLVAHRPEAVRPEPAPRSGRAAWALGLAAAAAAALWLAVRKPTVAPLASAPPVAASPSPSNGAAGRHRWEQPGSLRFIEAQVSYRAGTVAQLRPESRTITFEAGELDVSGHAEAPLRVVTPRFTVVLRQSRAVFAADRVQVLDGEVTIFSIDERQLAIVPAGESWPAAAPAIAPPPTAATVAPATQSASVVVSVVPVVPLLDRVRSALADGNAPYARRLIQRVLAGAASAHEQAAAELFLAESYLVEQQPDRALTAYRKVADAFPRLPEGEAAAFASAQVLYERGQQADAAEALRAYLARYPDGRFGREAKERLAELPSARP